MSDTVATPAELVAWMDDATHAILEGGYLDADRLLAYSSRPETAGKAGMRVTYWLEEMERLQKAQLRDGFPMQGNALEADAWRTRQDDRQSQMDYCAGTHAECLLRAALWARGTAYKAAAKAKPATKRSSAADAALAVLKAAA